LLRGFSRIAVLDLMLARHQQSEDLEICRRLASGRAKAAAMAGFFITWGFFC